VVTLAPTAPQVRAVIWRELKRVHRSGQLPGRVLTTDWKLDDGELIAMGRSPKDTDPTSIQGIHAKYVLIILDEATGIGKPLWDAVSSLAANEYSRILAIGNPDDPSTEFHEVCKPGSGWEVIPISAFETPNFTQEPVPDFLRPLLVSPTWVEERKRRWGESSPVYQSKVLGKFPEQASDGLFMLSDITKAAARELTPGDDINELGVDVARYGTDFTVVYHRRGPVARRVMKVNGRDTMEIAGSILRLVNELGVKRVKIDDIGLGGGVTDRLKELANEYGSDGLRRMKAEVVPINVGSRPNDEDGDEKFVNLRADLHWMLRERLQDGLIDLDPDDMDVQAQMADIKYKVKSTGQILVESKDDIKKRGRGSPDDLDALILAFAPGSTTLQIWERLGRG